MRGCEIPTPLALTQFSIRFCRKPCMWGMRTRTTESTPSPAPNLSLQAHTLQSHPPALNVRGTGSCPPRRGRSTTHCRYSYSRTLTWTIQIRRILWSWVSGSMLTIYSCCEFVFAWATEFPSNQLYGFLLIYFPVSFSHFWVSLLVRLISQESGTQPHVPRSNMLPIQYVYD